MDPIFEGLINVIKEQQNLIQSIVEKVEKLDGLGGGGSASIEDYVSGRWSNGYPYSSSGISYMIPATPPTDHTITGTINGPNYLYEYKYDYLSACGFGFNGNNLVKESIFSTTFFFLH